MQLLDGHVANAALEEDLKQSVQQLIASGERAPHLAVLMVGHSAPSEAYVGRVQKSGNALGFLVSIIRHDETIPEQELLQVVDGLNNDPEVDGILIQMPLPKHISVQKVAHAISPHKDVDAFNPATLGAIVQSKATFYPATPYGVVELLRHYEIPTRGKRVTVLGRSQIVGMPLATMLAQKAEVGDATVTICHSRTQNIEDELRRAEILIVAMGVPSFVKADMVAEGAIVVDVGINRIEDPSAPKGWRIVGDVDFDNVAPKCSWITPVPGGVGPMTIACVLRNTLRARTLTR